MPIRRVGTYLQSLYYSIISLDRSLLLADDKHEHTHRCNNPCNASRV